MIYSRSALAVMAAAAAVAGASVLGMSSASGSAGKTSSAATVNAVKATTETECVGPHTVTDEYLRKVNVSLCAVTDGQTLTVQFNADCFSALGATRYPHCSPEGSWSLDKGRTLVTEGRAGRSVLYPRPGTYTLTASFTVEAYKGPGDGEEGTSGFTLNGTMSRDITLTKAVAPGPRLAGGANDVDGARTVTVTNVGDKPAAGVSVVIFNNANSPAGHVIISDDKRCTDRFIETECALGGLAPGASASVVFTDKATEVCDRGWGRTPSFSWVYGADNAVGFIGDGPC